MKADSRVGRATGKINVVEVIMGQGEGDNRRELERIVWKDDCEKKLLGPCKKIHNSEEVGGKGVEMC